MHPVRKNTEGSAPPEPWMTLREAARALGVSRQTVLARALRGELETQRMARITFVSRASVDRALGAVANA